MPVILWVISASVASLALSSTVIVPSSLHGDVEADGEDADEADDVGVGVASDDLDDAADYLEVPETDLSGARSGTNQPGCTSSCPVAR